MGGDGGEGVDGGEGGEGILALAPACIHCSTAAPCSRCWAATPHCPFMRVHALTSQQHGVLMGGRQAAPWVHLHRDGMEGSFSHYLSTAQLQQRAPAPTGHLHAQPMH